MDSKSALQEELNCESCRTLDTLENYLDLLELKHLLPLKLLKVYFEWENGKQKVSLTFIYFDSNVVKFVTEKRSA